MNWKLFGTMTALIGVGTSIALAQGTAPTIVQGDYISNVFGNSNFVKNPNAKLNTKDVTTVTATVTRSTTTPLVATSEFTVAIGTANGTATWATRAFDAGMKNNNCEARFTYRGFAATSIVHIKQGANTVASLTLTPATDPRIASINFPCGDLSAATTFQVTDTAILAGTNEIGGIYVGLATNMANVAQAENVVQASRTGSQSFTTAETAIIFNTETKDVYGEFDTANGRFTAKRAGDYLVSSTWLSDYVSWTTGNFLQLALNKNTSAFCQSYSPIEQTQTMNKGITTTCVISLAVGDYIESRITQNQATMNSEPSAGYVFTSISRFPSSSELVVTPERQNTFAGIRGQAGVATNVVATAAWTKLTSTSTLTRTVYGKAKVETNNDYSITIENLPVGSYQVIATSSFTALSGAAANRTVCYFGLADTATGGAQIAGMQVSSTGDTGDTQQYILNGTLQGIYQNTSVANRTFFLQAYRNSGSGNCSSFADGNQPLTITITPLDQPSNSALYVQGPVLGAQTGAAIPAGYVGEVKQATIGVTNLTASVYNDLQSVTLTPGVWQCSSQARVWRNNSTWPANGEYLTCVSNITNTCAQINYNSQTSGSSLGVLPGTWTYAQISSIPTVIRYDGTNFTFANGATSASATGILAQKVYVDATAGTPQAQGRLECVRLN